MIVSIFNEYNHMDLSQISHANSNSDDLDVTARLLFCWILIEFCSLILFCSLNSIYYI